MTATATTPETACAMGYTFDLDGRTCLDVVGVRLDEDGHLSDYKVYLCYYGSGKKGAKLYRVELENYELSDSQIEEVETIEREEIRYGGDDRV